MPHLAFAWKRNKYIFRMSRCFGGRYRSITVQQCFKVDVSSMCLVFLKIFYLTKGLLLKVYVATAKNFLTIDRSSHRRCSIRKSVPRNFAKFVGKHLCQGLFYSKAACLRPATLLKKSFWHRCFHGNFSKFLRTLFLQNTPWQLLLHWDFFGSDNVLFKTLLWHHFEMETKCLVIKSLYMQ